MKGPSLCSSLGSCIDRCRQKAFCLEFRFVGSLVERKQCWAQTENYGNASVWLATTVILFQCGDKALIRA